MGYLTRKTDTTQIRVNKSKVGERIEERVQRMLYAGESMGDGAPLIYTDRRNGVEPQYNVRSDRFELALDAINGVTKDTLTKRTSYYEVVKPADDAGSVNATK